MSILESKPLKVFRTTKLKLTIFEKKLIASTIIILTFNILDIELTLWGIRLHLIEEGNPLMQLFIEDHPLYLKTYKFLLPIILGIACWWTRNTSQKLIAYGLGLTIIVYLFIMLMHAHWMTGALYS